MAHQDGLFVLDRKDAFKQMRNYLAGRLLGATRDEALLNEVIKCIFCKLLIQRTETSTTVSSDDLELARRYRIAFSELKKLLPNMFDDNEELLLDPTSIDYIDSILSNVDITSLQSDPIGDAYETFTGSIVRGQEGQFFTPRNVVETLVSIVNPEEGELIIDPACGTGGFLSYTGRYLLKDGASANKVARSVYGIDKDQYLANLASAHLSLVTLAPANVFCADSLTWSNGESEFAIREMIGKFDVVLTNPPFGTRIVAVSREAQQDFSLGYKWKRGPSSSSFIKQDNLLSSVPPQVLFVERCLSLVKTGGRVGMVVPESLVSSKKYQYVVQFIRESADILAVIGLPDAMFKTSGKGGTHTKTCLLYFKKRGNRKANRRNIVFMAEVRWGGKDSRGRIINKDELPNVTDNYNSFVNGTLVDTDNRGFIMPLQELVENILAPRYYDPNVKTEISSMACTHDLIKLGDLVADGLLQVTTGDEVGKFAYGTGDIPFIRTSDISNWEIKRDPKHCVNEDLYKELRDKQDIRESDILMVKDGTYLIGTCALVTKGNTKILFQSHLYKLRVTDSEKLSPYLLLAVLTSEPVKRQIKAKRFTQDIIDSLGSRLYEIVLPIPKETDLRDRITRMVEKSIILQAEARDLAQRACEEIAERPNTTSAIMTN